MDESTITGGNEASQQKLLNQSNDMDGMSDSDSDSDNDSNSDSDNEPQYATKSSKKSKISKGNSGTSEDTSKDLDPSKKNGPVVIDGVKYKMRYGSRRQVYNGTAYITKGNLKQNDIMKNKQDRFVSVKKSLMAKKEQRLLKYGYGAKKGKFGYVRVKPLVGPKAGITKKRRPRRINRKTKFMEKMPTESKSRKSKSRKLRRTSKRKRKMYRKGHTKKKM
jgi:hypothetical protein